MTTRTRLQTAVIWTRATGEPRRLADMQWDGEAVRLRYDREAGDLPGISILLPPSKFERHDIVWKGDEYEPLHPILMGLVPPTESTNLQYRIAERLLRFDRNTPDKEWRMLPLLGHDAIGHVDVFGNDEHAADWYAGRREIVKPHDLQRGPIVELAMKAMNAGMDPQTLDQVVDQVGRAPSPGGAMPKLMIPILWPGTGEVVDAIVKIEHPDGQHRDLLPMEDWAYDMHERLGLPVPDRAFVADGKGNRVLATRRFDRQDGRPIPLESFHSILKTADPETYKQPFAHPYDLTPSLEGVAGAFRNVRVGMTCRPAEDSYDLYSRVMISFLTGNGDLHLRNLSVLGARDEARLSPVYDPAPMRMFGNVISTALPFGRKLFFKDVIPQGFGDALIALGGAFQLSPRIIHRALDNALTVTEDAMERIQSLDISPATVASFDRLVSPVRKEIEDAALKLGRAIAPPAPPAPPAPGGPKP